MRIHAIAGLFFLTAFILFSCKKAKPAITQREPDMLVEQPSLHHIVDSLNYIRSKVYLDSMRYVRDSLQLDSLEPTFCGKYLVSGTYAWRGLGGHDGSTILTNDTVVITQTSGLYLVVDLYDMGRYPLFTSGFLPAKPDTGVYNYGWSNGIPYESLSFPKNGINKISYSGYDVSFHRIVYFSGTKIN